MSNYHNKIMNLAASREKQRLASSESASSAYLYGHRDARQAAAEITIEADQRIAELEAQLAAANARIKQLEACVAYWEAEAQGNASAELETYRAAMSGGLSRYKTP